MGKNWLKELVLYSMYLIVCSSTLLQARSIHRMQNQSTTPYIEVYWRDDPPKKKHRLYSNNLEDWAIFGRCDLCYLMAHQLPELITYRYEPEKTISRSTLNKEIEEFVRLLLKEVSRQRTIGHFKILKDNDFNFKRHCGVIIAKHLTFPIVIKVFRETPDTLVKPFSKGFIPSLFFNLAGGGTRYFMGFTRIKNLEEINAKIASDPRWKDRLTGPRKWFWIPQDGEWFTVVGHNLGTEEIKQADYPSLYCIVCDEIKGLRPLTISNSEDRALALDLANFIGNRIDPNISNYMIEINTQKIAFIDTEHFASLVGLSEEVTFESYVTWYTKLANHYFEKVLFRTKKERLADQRKPLSPTLQL